MSIPPIFWASIYRFFLVNERKKKTILVSFGTFLLLEILFPTYGSLQYHLCAFFGYPMFNIKNVCWFALQIESRNNKLEMQSTNDVVLIEELDKLLDRLRIPSEV